MERLEELRGLPNGRTNVSQCAVVGLTLLTAESDSAPSAASLLLMVRTFCARSAEENPRALCTSTPPLAGTLSPSTDDTPWAWPIWTCHLATPVRCDHQATAEAARRSSECASQA